MKKFNNIQKITCQGLAESGERGANCTIEWEKGVETRKIKDFSMQLTERCIKTKPEKNQIIFEPKENPMDCHVDKEDRIWCKQKDF